MGSGQWTSVQREGAESAAASEDDGVPATDRQTSHELATSVEDSWWWWKAHLLLFVSATAGLPLSVGVLWFASRGSAPYAIGVVALVTFGLVLVGGAAAIYGYAYREWKPNEPADDRWRFTWWIAFVAAPMLGAVAIAVLSLILLGDSAAEL